MRLHNRQIKARFWEDPDLIDWGARKRVLFIGLWQYAEDSGCVADSPAFFRARLFVAEDDGDVTVAKVAQWLQEMVDRGQLIRYEVGGKRYLFITHFHDHQRIDNPAAPDEIPLPQWVTFKPYPSNPRQGTYSVSSLTSGRPSDALTRPLQAPSEPLTQNPIVPDGSGTNVPSPSSSDAADAAPTSRRSRKRRETPEPDPEDLELARLLAKLMRQNNPDVRITPQQGPKWADEVRLMREVDGRTREDIRKHIEWTQRDPFWRRNCLSMGKVRQHWDRHTLQMQQEAEERAGARARASPGPSLPRLDTDEARREVGLL